MPNSATPPFASRCCVRRSSRGADLADPGRVGRCGAGRDRRPPTGGSALPSQVGVYFVLALCLFPGLGYRKVWAKFSAAPRGRKTPSAKAFRDLRRRLGAAPMRALFEVLAGPVAAPHAPGVRFGRYRTVAFDGCVSLKGPERTATGPGWASSAPRWHHRVSGDESMTVVNRRPSAAGRGVRGTGHRRNRLRAKAVAAVAHDVLVLVDRGFDAEAFLTDLAGTGAQFLARLRTTARCPYWRGSDGSPLRASVSWPCGSSPPTSPSPAPTAPATPPPPG